MSNEFYTQRSFAYVQHFLEFFSEVTRLKRLVESDVRRGGQPAAYGTPAPDAEFIVQRLQAMLEGQALLVARRGVDFAVAQYREAQYVMAALADDIFLYHLEWPGREVYRANILEYRLFKTRSAGERIFENIDSILRSFDRRQAELAPLYILMLSLGFKGKYRGEEHAAAIDDYANRLFELIFERPADLHAPNHQFMPQAYGHTLTGAPTPLPRLRFSWPLAIAGIFGAYVVVSEILWLAMTSDLGRVAGTVIQAATPLAR